MALSIEEQALCACEAQKLVGYNEATTDGNKHIPLLAGLSLAGSLFKTMWRSLGTWGLIKVLCHTFWITLRRRGTDSALLRKTTGMNAADAK